jgi:hypothetical protein
MTRAERIANMQIAKYRQFGTQGGRAVPICINVMTYRDGTARHASPYWIVGPMGLSVPAPLHIRCDSLQALGRTIDEIANLER